ncbi:hypothetical protein GCM10009682_31500 [Luedemannella flava]|uniref:Uncharacterized protein n=1 Tax=Luedemannella flava TaxID=349316 RepID=A0ABN2M2F8_9ACTN
MADGVAGPLIRCLVAGVVVVGVAACTPGSRSAAPAPSVGASPVPEDCARVIDAVAAPPDDYLVIGGDVALPEEQLREASDQGGDDPSARWFTKFGLLVRAGAAVEVAVAPQWAGRAAVDWGPADGPVARIRVPACPARDPGRPWLVYAGGVWSGRPACVPVVVTTASTEATVRYGLSQPC